MRDTQKPYRLAIFSKLDGNVIYNGNQINIYDEKKKVGARDDVYILLSTQQESNNDTSDTFITRSSIDIEIVQRTGSEVSKDEIDDIGDAVLQILCPEPESADILTLNGFQFANLYREKTITRAVEISPTETIIRKIITMTCSIVQS